MHSININVTKGSADCDDCGGYDWGHAELHINSKQVAYLVHDGHMGSGCWDGQMSTLYQWVLGLLGFSVEFTGLADGKSRMLPFKPLYQRGEDGYVDIPLPAQTILTVPAGLCPPESWEVEDAKADGLPIPEPEPYTESGLPYAESLDALYLGVLKSMATVGVEQRAA